MATLPVKSLIKKRNALKTVIEKLIDNGDDDGVQSGIIEKAKQYLELCEEIVTSKLSKDCSEEDLVQLMEEQEPFSAVCRKILKKEEVTVNKKTLKYPKLTFESFDLSTRTWNAFWGQFRVIHEDKDLDVNQKFQYLLLSLKEGTKAREMVLPYPRTGLENFEKAVAALKNRFGRDEVLIEMYTRELLSIVLSKNETDLSTLFDRIKTQLNALEGLGMTTERSAFLLYPLVESCLPKEILKVYERKRRDRDSSDVNANPLDDLMLFLEGEVLSEERVMLAEKPIAEHQPEPTAASLFVSRKPEKRDKPDQRLRQETSTICVFCERGHNSQDCIKAQSFTYEEKMEKIKKAGICFRCLRKGHRVMNCRFRTKCILCSRSHLAILCRGKEKETDTKTTDSAISCYSKPDSSLVYLKTVLVQVTHGEKIILARALLDDGSHRSYVSQQVVRNLNLKPQSKEFVKHGLFGGVMGPSKEFNVYNLCLRNIQNDNCVNDVSALAIDKICQELTAPSPLKDPDLFKELQERGITLTDISSTNRPIDLLLGADTLGSLLTGNISVFKKGVTAIESKLGWSVVGTSQKKAKRMVNLCLNTVSLPSMWDLENIGISEPVIPKKSEVEDRDVLRFLWWENDKKIKVYRHTRLDYEEMNTLLCDCERVVNSRPLTYVSDDTNEPRPLTPAHFIQPITCTNVNDFDLIDSNNTDEKVKHLQNLREALRERFRNEYLAELVKTPGATTRHTTITPGDIVLVGADNVKRQNWPLAKVIETVVGKDGVTRVAKLRVKNGELYRPLQRLYPLELRANDFETSDDRNNFDNVTVTQDPLIDDKDDEVTTRSGRVIKTPSRLDPKEWSSK